MFSCYSLFAQAVNTFKNARPVSPFVNPVAVKSTAPAVTNNTEVKQTKPATKVEPDR